MPAFSEGASALTVSSGNNKKSDPVAPTVISVNVTPPDAFVLAASGQTSDVPSGGLLGRTTVGRTLSNRSTAVGGIHPKGGGVIGGGGPQQGPGGGKKLGHRRVRDDGEVTYKKFETTQLIGSIQLGLQYTIGSMAKIPDRDLLMQDFMSIETVSFTRDGLLQQTPAHNYSEFRFRTYASYAFRFFRKLFAIDTDLFVASLCSEAMVELSGSGASGSIFYVTRDDNFICKTVMHKEGEFLQKLLPGYYMNLQQNPRTLLPKFFGLYCYSCNAKNVRIVVMNNLLPSGLKMHQKFDLKGSTYKRKASKNERAKDSPTFKDLDFLELYPQGILLQPDLYHSLLTSIQRDCRVLESFKIMDYSLLIGIHNLDQAAKERDQEVCGTAAETSSNNMYPSECDSSSTGAGFLERQGSFQHRERMIAHSTALESITMEVESVGNAPTGGTATVAASGSGHNRDPVTSGTAASNAVASVVDEADSGINNVWGGIPAKNHRGENLLLFIGIIDILQSYGLLKQMEHYWKSLIHDGDTVSVHRPGFYARRFKSFMSDKVFKKFPTPLRPALSFRRSHFRRTLSKENECQQSPPPTGGCASPTTINAPLRGKKEAGVTVITIGDDSTNNVSDTAEVYLPPVLQNRKRVSSGGTATRPVSTVSTTSTGAVVVVNADGQQGHNPPDVVGDVTGIARAISPITPSAPRSPTGVNDDIHETGSVITMTSDERVQIFVPSPQTTPYNTITKLTSSITSTSSSGVGAAAALAPLFAPQRMPSSESYRSLTPLNMDHSKMSSPSHEPSHTSTSDTSSQVTAVGPRQGETSLEMVLISMTSSSTTTSTEMQTQQTDRTIANDLPSLPHDGADNGQDSQPISLSHIQLDVNNGDEQEEAGKV